MSYSSTSISQNININNIMNKNSVLPQKILTEKDIEEFNPLYQSINNNQKITNGTENKTDGVSVLEELADIFGTPLPPNASLNTFTEPKKQRKTRSSRHHHHKTKSEGKNIFKENIEMNMGSIKSSKSLNISSTSKSSSTSSQKAFYNNTPIYLSSLKVENKLPSENIKKEESSNNIIENKEQSVILEPKSKPKSKSEQKLNELIMNNEKFFIPEKPQLHIDTKLSGTKKSKNHSGATPLSDADYDNFLKGLDELTNIIKNTPITKHSKLTLDDNKNKESTEITTEIKEEKTEPINKTNEKMENEINIENEKISEDTKIEEKIENEKVSGDTKIEEKIENKSKNVDLEGSTDEKINEEKINIDKSDLEKEKKDIEMKKLKPSLSRSDSLRMLFLGRKNTNEKEAEKPKTEEKDENKNKNTFTEFKNYFFALKRKTSSMNMTSSTETENSENEVNNKEQDEKKDLSIETKDNTSSSEKKEDTKESSNDEEIKSAVSNESSVLNFFDNYLDDDSDENENSEIKEVEKIEQEVEKVEDKKEVEQIEPEVKKVEEEKEEKVEQIEQEEEEIEQEVENDINNDTFMNNDSINLDVYMNYELIPNIPITPISPNPEVNLNITNKNSIKLLPKKLPEIPVSQQKEKIEEKEVKKDEKNNEELKNEIYNKNITSESNLENKFNIQKYQKYTKEDKENPVAKKEINIIKVSDLINNSGNIKAKKVNISNVRPVSSSDIPTIINNEKKVKTRPRKVSFNLDREGVTLDNEETENTTLSNNNQKAVESKNNKITEKDDNEPLRRESMFYSKSHVINKPERRSIIRGDRNSIHENNLIKKERRMSNNLRNHIQRNDNNGRVSMININPQNRKANTQRRVQSQYYKRTSVNLQDTDKLKELTKTFLEIQNTQQNQELNTKELSSIKGQPTIGNNTNSCIKKNKSDLDIYRHIRSSDTTNIKSTRGRSESLSSNRSNSSYRSNASLPVTNSHNMYQHDNVKVSPSLIPSKFVTPNQPIIKSSLSKTQALDDDVNLSNNRTTEGQNENDIDNEEMDDESNNVKYIKTRPSWAKNHIESSEIIKKNENFSLEEDKSCDSINIDKEFMNSMNEMERIKQQTERMAHDQSSIYSQRRSSLSRFSVDEARKSYISSTGFNSSMGQRNSGYRFSRYSRVSSTSNSYVPSHRTKLSISHFDSSQSYERKSSIDSTASTLAADNSYFDYRESYLDNNAKTIAQERNEIGYMNNKKISCILPSSQQDDKYCDYLTDVKISTENISAPIKDENENSVSHVYNINIFNSNNINNTTTCQYSTKHEKYTINKISDINNASLLPKNPIQDSWDKAMHSMSLYDDENMKPKKNKKSLKNKFSIFKRKI